MGCGCNKGGVRNSMRNPVIGPRGISPRTIRSNINIQSNPTPVPPTNQGMDADRLRVERLRREAIRRALNK